MKAALVALLSNSLPAIVPEDQINSIADKILFLLSYPGSLVYATVSAGTSYRVAKCIVDLVMPSGVVLREENTELLYLKSHEEYRCSVFPQTLQGKILCENYCKEKNTYHGKD